MRPVSDDAVIRRANLNRLSKARGWDAHGLAKAVGEGGYSYWQALLTNTKKAFGEKVARKIEERCSLPRLWLDTVHAPVPEPVAKETTPTHGVLQWPFSVELHAAVMSCKPAERTQIENLVRVHLRLPLLAATAEKSRAA